MVGYPGSQFPDEYVILGGHLDGFDGGSGAVDNASGATVAMEAARLILAVRRKAKTYYNGSAMGGRGVWFTWFFSMGKTKSRQASRAFQQSLIATAEQTALSGLAVSKAMMPDFRS